MEFNSRNKLPRRRAVGIYKGIATPQAAGNETLVRLRRIQNRHAEKSENPLLIPGPSRTHLPDRLLSGAHQAGGKPLGRTQKGPVFLPRFQR